MGNPSTATVSTANGDVIVKKLVLADYAEMLNLLQQLPTVFNEIAATPSSDWTNAHVIQVLPGLMATALPEVTKIIAFVTDKDGDFFMQLDLADILDVVDGALTVNDFERIAASLKKIRGRGQSQTSIPANV